MEHCVIRFRDVTSAHQASAGGKGGMLARMLQAGYPVPDGFVILPAAFQQDELAPEAWELVAESLRTLRRHQPSAPVAVRSSALSEDSDAASFAGEFESVLNVRTEEEVREAIAAVRHSGRSERVQAYSRHQGMTEAHQVAVVVQLMVPAALAGVLFTADPITGSHARMSGNFVHGLGERLVSGEADAQPFSFERPKGVYTGPEELKPFAKKLYALAARLERELKKPQDIEWAAADGKLFILQVRPVTTLRTGNPDTYEWNDSLDGDFLWTNTNVGEAMSDVITPLSWSMIRKLDEEQSVLPSYYLFSGNICGRAYTNISLGLSLYPAFGKEMTPLIQRMSDVFGHMPEGVRVPVYPFSRMSLLRTMIPLVFTRLRKMRKAARAIPRHLAENAEVCAELTQRIQQTDTAAELALLWRDTLLPLNFAALWAAMPGGRGMVIAHKLKQELTRLAGQEDANTLLSNLRGDAALESLGPVIGISRIMKGDMSQEEYKRSYGHRGPHEFELSFPHPGEANDWLAEQMEQFAASGVNVEEMLQKQSRQYEEARERLNRRQPAKTVKRIGKQLQKIAAAARLREAVRSEWTRTFRVNRAFALQAGKLTGIGEAVHFLYIDELLQLLGGDRSALKHVPARRETHEKYKALPPLPSLIRGRFDAQQWAGDPHRRVDYYDAGQPAPPPDRSETLKGFAGAAGRVEGSVRVLYRPEEGGELQAGEILVASTTNVGWTPLFPRAAAIITDIGAPLSHAAIVARELGIPAVVGCGSATARLKTGDRVIVDGGQGLVYLVDRG